MHHQFGDMQMEDKERGKEDIYIQSWSLVAYWTLAFPMNMAIARLVAPCTWSLSWPACFAWEEVPG